MEGTATRSMPEIICALNTGITSETLFGDVLVGLYGYDLLENKIIPYRYIRYEKAKD